MTFNPAYRTIYAYDGRKQIVASAEGETGTMFEARAANILFPGKTMQELRAETGLGWPIMTGLDYPTRAMCKAESPSKATIKT